MGEQPPPYAQSNEKMGGPPQPGFQPRYGPQQQPYGAPQQPYGAPQQPYPQGAPGYPPHGGQQQVTVIQQPVVTTTVVQQYRESPVQTVCPYCHAQIVTSVNYDVGTFAWLVAGVCCIVGCWLGCCFIPFCMDGCKDAVHHCPSCQQQIARWSRL